MKEKILHVSRRILFHDLIKGSSVVFVGSMVGNVLAFLFNLFVVRKLSYSAYGEYAALISLLTLATIPAQSISPVVVRFASSYLAKKNEGKAVGLYQHVAFFLSILAICFLGFFIFGNSLIQGFLHITNAGYTLLIGLTVGITYASVVNTAYLQSLLRFGLLSIFTIVGSTIKLVLGVALVLLGFQVDGALWAILIALLVPFLLGFVPLQRFFLSRHKDKTIEVREIVLFALPAIISLFALSSFTSTDVLLVKHFFSSNNAGLYGGLSLVGRVIFYFTAPITMVMFPLVVKRYEQRGNFQNILYLALLLVALPSLAITVFYFLFPNIAILIFLGGRGYVRIAPYLGWYGMFLTFFSLLNVLVNFFLSIKQTNVVYLVALGALLQAVFIALFHASFSVVITISVLVTLGLLLLLLLYYYRFYATQKTNS